MIYMSRQMLCYFLMFTKNFMKLSHQFYLLDCAHFVTAPGLAWKTSLKMSQQPLELLTDIDMLLMVEMEQEALSVCLALDMPEKSTISHTPDYRENEAPRYIMYWYANNLYGWSMSQFLPHGGFEQCVANHMTEECILYLDDYGGHGYIFEVDLKTRMALPIT